MLAPYVFKSLTSLFPSPHSSARYSLSMPSRLDLHTICAIPYIFSYCWKSYEDNTYTVWHTRALGYGPRICKRTNSCIVSITQLFKCTSQHTTDKETNTWTRRWFSLRLVMNPLPSLVTEIAPVHLSHISRHLSSNTIRLPLREWSRLHTHSPLWPIITARCSGVFPRERQKREGCR